VKTNLPTENVPFNLASRWLKDSGIQSPQGGLYSWYDLKDKTYSFIYSEITGYAITTLLFLEKIYKERIYLDKAKRAARWIIKEAMLPCGAIRTRLYKEDELADEAYSFCGENVFSFDLGMVLYGMINLYKRTKDNIFFDTSKKMADFLLSQMHKDDGSFSPLYNAKTKRHIESFDKWSNQSGAFHAKVSLGLIDVFEVTKEKKYRDAAARVCEYALSFQQEDGRFITDRAKKTTNLHPHSYTAEGLLYSGAYLGEERFIKAAQKATEWVFSNLSSGKLDELYTPESKSFNGFQRCDVLAQSLRLGIIFSVSDTKLKKLESFLLKHQYVGFAARQQGGFRYNISGDHINSWCTMFFLQAFAFSKDKSLFSKEKPIELFI
jgi:hypothetical protein